MKASLKWFERVKKSFKTKLKLFKKTLTIVICKIVFLNKNTCIFIMFHYFVFN